MKKAKTDAGEEEIVSTTDKTEIETPTETATTTEEKKEEIVEKIEDEVMPSDEAIKVDAAATEKAEEEKILEDKLEVDSSATIEKEEAKTAAIPTHEEAIAEEGEKGE